jgi:acyl-CoA reductase-like NAD-dependent aldehyde dehydrogenase
MDNVRRYSMLIDGDWVDTEDRFEIRSPATEELVASVAKGGREHADRAIGAAKAAHADGRWRRTPPAGPRFERGFWVEPTIFTDVRNDMTVAREESFGPVLAVIRAESTEAAIRIANDTEYGLSAGVWSTDNQRALEVAGQLEAGTVWVNDWHMVNAAYPFGGYKQSGLGRELGPHALDEYTEEKFVHLDLSGRLDRRAYPLLLSTPPA